MNLPSLDASENLDSDPRDFYVFEKLFYCYFERPLKRTSAFLSRKVPGFLSTKFGSAARIMNGTFVSCATRSSILIDGFSTIPFFFLLCSLWFILIVGDSICSDTACPSFFSHSYSFCAIISSIATAFLAYWS